MSALPLTLHRTPDSYGNAEEGVLVVATAEDGEPSVKIQVKKQVAADYRLVIHLDPNAGGISATLVEEATGYTKLLEVDSSDGESGIIPMDCCNRWSDWYCGYGCSPYDNCTCVSYRTCEFVSYTPCPCEMTTSCQGCSDQAACD